MHEFEDYPDLTGGLRDARYTPPTNFITDGMERQPLTELYYKKVYKDIYDDEIINYDQNTYMHVSSIIVKAIEDGKYNTMIVKIQSLLNFKEIYHNQLYKTLESKVLNMTKDTSHYLDDNGEKHLLFIPELERQSNWSLDLIAHPISRQYNSIRNSIRCQFYCREILMDKLCGELLHTNGNMIKMELAMSYKTKYENLNSQKALYTIFSLMRLRQVELVNEMSEISNEMSNMKFCAGTNYSDDREVRTWMPVVRKIAYNS